MPENPDAVTPRERVPVRNARPLFDGPQLAQFLHRFAEVMPDADGVVPCSYTVENTAPLFRVTVVYRRSEGEDIGVSATVTAGELTVGTWAPLRYKPEAIADRFGALFFDTLNDFLRRNPIGPPLDAPSLLVVPGNGGR